MLTPHCSAASGMVAPPCIVSITRLRKSSEYGFAIHAGLLPVGSLNHIRAGLGIPDSAFSGNALSSAYWRSSRFSAHSGKADHSIRPESAHRPPAQTELATRLSVLAAYCADG